MKLFFSFGVVGLIFAQVSFAQINSVQSLQCFDDDKQHVLSLNNTEVLKWKQVSKDQFKARALIQGTVVSIFPDRTGHDHFSIDINGDKVGDIEVIYNSEFGSLPRLMTGMVVMACGDYITARRERPSPMGAIIHWVHYNPGDRDGGRHPHGFLVINGKPYGFSNPN